jgi:uncharacterized protein
LQSLNPLRLAKAEEQFEGVIDLREMQRISDLLQQQSGEIHYQMSFFLDGSERVLAEVELKTVLQMLCQRCLKTMSVEVERNTHLAFVSDKTEIATLPAEYEPLVLDESDDLSINELVQDELLLAIPLAPMHLPDECSAAKEVEKFKDNGKVMPFADLAKLKKKTS